MRGMPHECLMDSTLSQKVLDFKSHPEAVKALLHMRPLDAAARLM